MHGFSYVLDVAVDTIERTFTLLGVVIIISTLNPLLVLLFVALVLLSTWIESITKKKQIDMSLKLTNIERKWMYYGDLMEEYLNVPCKMRNNEMLPLPCGDHAIEFKDELLKKNGAYTQLFNMQAQFYTK